MQVIEGQVPAYCMWLLAYARSWAWGEGQHCAGGLVLLYSWTPLLVPLNTLVLVVAAAM